MSILSFIKSWINPSTVSSGLLVDTADRLEHLPRHELFAGAPPADSVEKDWSPFCPPFRYQGSSWWCTAFAGTSIGYIFEKKQNRESPLFSPMELFYRTGGSTNGNYLVSTTRGMCKTLVLESDVPTVLPNDWGTAQFLKYQNLAHASEAALETGVKFRLRSAAIVKDGLPSMQNALNVSPLLIAVGIGRGYFDKVAPRQTSYSAYHAVVLTKIEDDGSYKIFDSLTQKRDFDGFHHLASNYEILLAVSFIDIPENWKDIQNKDTQDHKALSHYGKKRVLSFEQIKADALLHELKRHPTLTSYFGREWTICVNALAYGDYSIQDLLNHYTYMRRTGRPIYDLNLLRNAQ